MMSPAQGHLVNSYECRMANDEKKTPLLTCHSPLTLSALLWLRLRCSRKYAGVNYRKQYSYSERNKKVVIASDSEAI